TMQDKLVVRLDVKGDYDKARQVLQTIEHVETIDLVGPMPGPEEPLKLRVVARDKTDIREDVFYKLADARLPILEMNKENQSLEDIVIKLTTTEKSDHDSDAETSADESGNDEADVRSEVKSDA